MNKYLFWGIIGVSAAVVIFSVANKKAKINDSELEKDAKDLIKKIGRQDV